MDVYNIKDLSHTTRGMEIQSFSEMLVSVSNNPKFKTQDLLSKYPVIFLKNAKVDIKETKYVFLGDIGEGAKKSQFFLQDKNSIFKLNLGDKSCYGTACAGEVFLDPDKEKVVAYIYDKIQAPLESFDEVEKKAWNWLEGPDTGASSLTVCYHTFPQLSQHYRLHDLIQHNRESHPLDNADFIRVLGFLKAVPEAKEKLEIMREINPQWNKLLNNWAEIETALKQKNNEYAYDLIKKSISKEVELKLTP